MCVTFRLFSLLLPCLNQVSTLNENTNRIRLPRPPSLISCSLLCWLHLPASFVRLNTRRTGGRMRNIFAWCIRRIEHFSTLDICTSNCMSYYIHTGSSHANRPYIILLASILLWLRLCLWLQQGKSHRIRLKWHAKIQHQTLWQRWLNESWRNCSQPASQSVRLIASIAFVVFYFAFLLVFLLL